MNQAQLRNWLRDVLSCDAGSAICACSLFAAFFLIAGCTASWQAPVESRTNAPTKASTTAPTKASNKASNKAPTKAGPARIPISGEQYRVRRGDTLHGIAWQSGIDYRSIAAWNRLSAPYRIYPGQSLRLRRPATRPARRVSTSAATRIQASLAKQSRTAAKPKPPAVAKPVRKPPSETKPDLGSRSLVWRWPLKGKVVSRFKGGDSLRNGVKIAGRDGDLIRSAEGGKVVYSGSGLIGYGRLIIIKHSAKYLSAYGHNRKLLVGEGDRVTKGQTIAEMGTANNGDALLHFEIRRDGKPVDPLRLLPGH